MVFVDGWGWGADDASNPVVAHAPGLHAWLRAHARPVDATMGVPGLPQSATGQAAILTGRNTAARIGRHVESFPGPELRALVHEHNLLKTLVGRGLKAAFANAYFLDERARRVLRNRPSVTTVAAQSAFGCVRGEEDMARGDAVYHDLTRESLRARGYTGPLTTPEESARHLLGIAAAHHFTLFEYFQTDRAGHRADPVERAAVLERLDRFWSVVRPWGDQPGNLLLFTSDHGNIEDASTTAHTLNPVPFGAAGEGADALLESVQALDDIAPELSKVWMPRSGAPPRASPVEPGRGSSGGPGRGAARF